MKNKQKHTVTMVILIVIVATTSFFAGTKYQQRKLFSNFRTQNSNQENFTRGMGRGLDQNVINNDLIKNRGQNSGFRQTFGEIINLDEKTLTFKMADGSSKLVLLSDSTVISQSTLANKEDLQIGTKIIVTGDTNSDGSISGRNIEINSTLTTTTPIIKK